MVRSPDLESADIKSAAAYKSKKDTEVPISPTSVNTLLALEGQVRSIETQEELRYFFVNETRKLIPYRQAVVAEKKPGGRYRVTSISSLAMVDRGSSYVLWIEDLLVRLEDDSTLNSVKDFSLTGYSNSNEQHLLEEYPFLETLWVPFSNSREGVYAGMLLTREQPWNNQQLVISRRLGEAYEHAWSALRGTTRSVASWLPTPRKLLLGTGLLLLMMMFLPVSLTTLAPVEVVASKPQISAAPISGVIASIAVDPNTVVALGDLLYRFEDTDFLNHYRIAQQNEQVAAAKLRRATQSVFDTPDEAHGIAILEAELNRSHLEKNYAKEQLDKVEVRATQPGIALYGDRGDWIGKPVVVGEQVLRVADPSNVEFRVDVPVKDSIVLQEGARVRIYLDADPIRSIEARLVSASYHATELPGATLAYRSTARLDAGEEANLRIGLHGTAKVYGEDVSLFFYLFRRPLASLRQFLGV